LLFVLNSACFLSDFELSDLGSLCVAAQFSGSGSPRWSFAIFGSGADFILCGFSPLHCRCAVPGFGSRFYFAAPWIRSIWPLISSLRSVRGGLEFLGRSGSLGLKVSPQGSIFGDSFVPLDLKSCFFSLILTCTGSVSSCFGWVSLVASRGQVFP
jgi:hypothetical protein